MKKLIKYTGLFLLLLLSSNSWAATNDKVPMNDFMKDVAPEVVYIFMSVCALMLIATWALFKAVNIVKKKMFGVDEDELVADGEITVEEAEEIKYKKRGFWERFFKAKPTITDKDVMLDHDYDGIRELDNPAPPWFMFLFYGTISFAVVYLLIYHVFMSAPLQTEEYEIQMANAKAEVAAYLAEAAERVDESSVTVLTDAGAIAAGEKVFNTNCVSCHGSAGQGTQVPVSIGPNLTDNYWIHGGDIQSVFKTIKYGVIEKGMRAWGEVLSPAEMQQVASYLFAQHGKELENAKEPQGELYNPEGSGAEEGDSTVADSTMIGTEISMLK